MRSKGYLSQKPVSVKLSPILGPTSPSSIPAQGVAIMRAVIENRFQLYCCKNLRNRRKYALPVFGKVGSNYALTS